MAFIFSITLLLLLIPSVSALTTDTSIYNTADAAKQDSRSISTINNHAAVPLIIRYTNAYTTTASARSTNKIASTAASTAYSTHSSTAYSTNSPSEEFPSLTGSLSSTIPKSKEGNNNSF